VCSVDVTDPCYNGTTVCSNASQYLFYDSFHPITAADTFAAEGFFQAVTPEPSTVVPLMMSGLILCAVLRKRARSIALPALPRSIDCTGRIGL
jgi:phospholipase/lecithinase/hemolysin